VTSASTWRGTSTRARSSTGAGATVSVTSTRHRLWDPYADAAATHPRDRTLYVRAHGAAPDDHSLGGQQGPVRCRRARSQPPVWCRTSRSRRSRRSPRWR
jgi:hypothetical protein